MKHNHASEVTALQGSIGEEKRLMDQAKEEIQKVVNFLNYSNYLLNYPN